MKIELKNNTATIKVSKYNLQKVIDFANERKIQHSIIIVKKGIFKTYVVKLYRCNKYSLDLMELAFK